MSDFDEFLKQSGQPIEDFEQPLKIGLTLHKGKSRQPLIWQISTLIPIPKYEAGTTLVQGNVKVSELRNATLKILELIEQEKQELLRHIEMIDTSCANPADTWVRMVWRI